MSFALIIFVRVLFVACMVFILGYIFGSFGKRPVLKTISRVSAILVILLFIAMNILFVRAAIGGRWHHGVGPGSRHHGAGQWRQECPFTDDRQGQDSLGLDRRHRQGQDALRQDVLRLDRPRQRDGQDVSERDFNSQEGAGSRPASLDSESGKVSDSQPASQAQRVSANEPASRATLTIVRG